MKLIPMLLTIGMLAVGGWAQDAKSKRSEDENLKLAKEEMSKQYFVESVKCAESGNAKEQYTVGARYFYLGNEFDAKYYEEAVKWYTRSAEQGNDKAQWQLGCFYDDGRGVTQDKKEAVKWWTKAAEQGNRDAKSHLKSLKLLSK